MKIKLTTNKHMYRNDDGMVVMSKPGDVIDVTDEEGRVIIQAENGVELHVQEAPKPEPEVVKPNKITTNPKK